MQTGRQSVSVALLGLTTMIFLAGLSEGVDIPVRFGPETARADLLNKVSERVFSLVETTEDDESASSIVKAAFKSALKQVLTAVKGEVEKTCEELADLAAERIRDAENRGEEHQEKEHDDVSDFVFLDSSKKSETSIRPHGFLQETKFVDTLKALAKGALKSLAVPMKAAIVEGVKPMLPKLKSTAVEIFKQACQQAEEKVQEA
ncbi:putative microneme protein MIC11 [Neospora caninum Liverpool]|uniref:Microneme protein MIC11, putative n=2 Tax=Neospora caninum TaxID=29176 RepID=F0VEZ1_NEOCL|nr:putative microneme protein MIC11 [Neospora caninum Liverpool]AAN16380.1 microneme protein NcMIC11 precursor [Neospora caninum]CBZ52285.1 putative microneme protein MIC11 [Neospora caninum Liverpool]CEL66253.1 TPA: microneme protein MIC11, putative [Neospora caninum Liverpool]|eukprot:XP_003882317.1 putative microneme protein MIC11 [Neospora caninum Liverpool]